MFIAALTAGTAVTLATCGGGSTGGSGSGPAGKINVCADFPAAPASLHIVAKRDAHAFEMLPRRWVVKRTFAGINWHRRTVRDYEHLPASHEIMILWSSSSSSAQASRSCLGRLG